MNKEIKQLINELQATGLSLESIADQVRYSWASVYSWSKGMRNPKYPVVIELKRILEKRKATSEVKQV